VLSAWIERGRWESVFVDAALTGLTVLLIVEATLALRWPMIHDTPLLHYAAWSVSELGRAPYRDVFETSMPGSLLFHIAIGRTVGWSDAAFQLVNLAWLLATLGFTWLALAPIDRRAAWAGSVLFGLMWYGNGPWMVLQRDGAAILPISAAVALAMSARGTRRGSALLIGLCFGAAAMVKPHLAIGFPLVVLFPWATWGGPVRRAWDEAVQALVWGGVGLIIPVAAALGWVHERGGLAAFLSILADFLPIHLSLSGDHVTMSGGQRLVSVVTGTRDLGGHAVWLAPLFVVFLRAIEPGIGRPARSRLGLWVALAAAYAIEPAFAGQFWDYHWMPFQYFAAVAGGLVLVAARAEDDDAPPSHGIAPLVLFAATVFFGVTLAPNFAAELRGEPPLVPKEGRVDAIATYLREHLEPGDTVQPLDWTGGAVHGMFRAGAPPATRFLYDYVFYNRADTPYVARLRSELIAGLNEAPPRFVVRFEGERVSGPQALHAFPELERVLVNRYVLAVDGDGYTILELRRAVPADEADRPREDGSQILP